MKQLKTEILIRLIGLPIALASLIYLILYVKDQGVY
jgi:hypothetical protein